MIEPVPPGWSLADLDQAVWEHTEHIGPGATAKGFPVGTVITDDEENVRNRRLATLDLGDTGRQQWSAVPINVDGK
jgi:hypothetical protein